MKKWFTQHKIALISLVVLTMILFIMTMIMINYISQPYVLKELDHYIKTNQITPPLKTFAIIVIINLLIFAIWIVFFVYIMWKIFFPTKETVHKAFQLDSLEFLYTMPSKLKKELKRDE